jgi:hypothetical protein
VHPVDTWVWTYLWMDLWTGNGGMTVSIAESNASVGVTELTPEEAAAAFDRIARTALDLSGENFLAALDKGKFDGVDPDVHPGLLDVLMALPLVR